jgi:sortase A
VTDRIAEIDEIDDSVTVDEGGDDLDSDHADGAASPDGPPQGPGATPTPGSWWARHRERRRQRVSKWDRPPDPKDWRFFVGTLGKVLIATGLLMFGFVAYQLWGTGIETARAQNRLETAFEAAITENAPVADTVPSTTTGEPDEPDAADEPAAADDPDAADDPLPDLPDPVPSQVVPGGVDLTDVAVEQDIPPIERGDVIARLEIPKIHDDPLYVVAGVTLDDLKAGPGHYPDTPLPGQLGNASIAGHRTTYGAPFFDVDQLVAGDQLIVTTITGDRYVYEVTGVQIVSASDYWVVTTRDPGVAELTLTSCHPKYTARDRIVVHSVLVPELSSNVGVANFYELDDAPTEAIPGDDPTLVAEGETATEPSGEIVATVDPDAGNDLVVGDTDGAVDEGVDPTTAPEAATTPPADDEVGGEVVGEVPTAPEPGTVEQPQQIDAFSQGWFDDDEAWPQIALWGLALTIISLLAYQVSKRTRHDSIGFAVGIAPFLFSLYFFFQNVNRLLPPGL